MLDPDPGGEKNANPDQKHWISNSKKNTRELVLVVTDGYIKTT